MYILKSHLHYLISFSEHPDEVGKDQTALSQFGNKDAALLKSEVKAIKLNGTRGTCSSGRGPGSDIPESLFERQVTDSTKPTGQNPQAHVARLIHEHIKVLDALEQTGLEARSGNPPSMPLPPSFFF